MTLSHNSGGRAAVMEVEERKVKADLPAIKDHELAQGCAQTLNGHTV